MVLKEDFGNLGNLVAYLNGEASLEDRIKKAKIIFFIPLSVPPQHKEEVVILWLADILTSNKVLTFAKEEVHLIWNSLRTFLCSKRLKALCSHHWVCPFTSLFIQTLITTVSETTDKIIKEEAVLICECLLKNPSLSPQIAQLSSQSLPLCAAILTWINKRNVCPSLYNFLTLLIQKALFILTNQMSKSSAMVLVYDKLLLPSIELSLNLQNSPIPEVKELLHEIKILLVSSLFSKANVKLYNTLLKLPMDKESKEHLPMEGESLFGFLIKCISRTDKEVAVYVLREYATYLFRSYKEHNQICYRFLVNVMYLFGISLNKGPTVEVNSIAAQTLSQVQLAKTCRDKFIGAILEALLNVDINLTGNLSTLTIKDWIENLGRHLLQEKGSSEYTLKCVLLIIKIDPMCVTNIKTIFSDILECETPTDASYLMLDNALCELLNVYVKLRKMDKMYEILSKTLLTFNASSTKMMLSQEAWLLYDKKPLLPPNFMQRFLSSVKELGTQMWMNLWSSISEILSNACHSALQTKESIPSVAMTVWLSSRVLSATSVLESVSVSGIAVQISRLMNTLAEEGIKVLVEDVLALEDEERSSVCGSLLSLILVWSELHIKLSSTETGYTEGTNFSEKVMWETNNFKDFSALIPFVSEETWTKLLSTGGEEEEGDSSRFLVTQLVIQKLSLLHVQRLKHKGQGVVFDDGKAAHQLQKCLSYIAEVNDAAKFPLSSGLIAVHLPSLMPLMKKPHLMAAARMLVSGTEEDSEPWIKFGKSVFFQEYRIFQSMILSLLCHDMLSLLSGGKTKMSEGDLNEIVSKNKPKYLSQKVLIGLIKLQEQNHSEFTAGVANCLGLIDESMTCSEKNPRLKKQSENKLLSILGVLHQFPLSLVKPTLLISVVTLCLTVLVEEGGVSGRLRIIYDSLRLLNRTTFNPLFTKIFTHSKQKPFSILLWLVKDSQNLLQNFAVEDTHLRVITEMEEPPQSAEAHSNPLGELLHLLNALTEAFLKWDKTGKKSVLYAEALLKDSKSAKNSDIYLIAALMLGIHLRKRCKNRRSKENSSFLDTLQILGRWSLEESKGVDLSKVTSISLANCLSIFTTLLVVKKQLKEPITKTVERGKKRKLEEEEEEIDENSDEETETMEVDTKVEPEKSSMEGLSVDWATLLSDGSRLADLTSLIESTQLKKLCLEFFISVTASVSFSSSVNSWTAFQKAWTIISFNHDSSDSQAVKSLLRTLSLKDYKSLLSVLLKDTWKDPLEDRRLCQWYAVVTSEREDKPGVKAKSVALEQFISIACIRIANETLCADDVSTLIMLLKIFNAILECKNSVFGHSKSMMLNACANVISGSSSTSDFVKVFQEAAKLLNTVLLNEPHIISNRPASIMSSITHLTLAVMDQSDEEKNLPANAVKELESCGRELEKLVQGTKPHDIHFFKIAPFSLAKIVEKMQQTRLYPVVKESIERVVYHLLDYSDSHSMRHLMVTLSPAVITLLKHLHSSFTQNLRFNPTMSR